MTLDEAYAHSEQIMDALHGLGLVVIDEQRIGISITTDGIVITEALLRLLEPDERDALVARVVAEGAFDLASKEETA